ncbi:MAG: 23S rRNA (uracil(1939)-C(5))-methyltransferase RlmD [Cyanobacteria bacterium]|nr:23S rRNA (uracil(1939)-C(5))-methyltransferase RlmD [Cyanobacteriota bacterium]
MTPSPSTTNKDSSPSAVHIEKLVYGGAGLGRFENGEIALVPYTLPGETVLVHPQSPVLGKAKKNNFALTEMKEAAPERILPICSVFLTCGGCHWQHLPVGLQREWKQKILEETLRRMGPKDSGSVPVLPILSEPRDSGWGYRNKVQWHIKDGKIGYYQPESHQIIPFETCGLVSGTINRIYQTLQEALKNGLLKGDWFEKIEVRANQNGEILMTLWTSLSHESLLSEKLLSIAPENQENLASFFSKQHFEKRFPQCVGIGIVSSKGYQLLWGQSYLMENLNTKTNTTPSEAKAFIPKYQVSWNSFFQINAGVTLALLNHISSLLPKEPCASFLDLYSGVGLFSLWFQHRIKTGVAVELSEAAVQDAQVNFKQNGCNHIHMVAGDMKQQLSNLAHKKKALGIKGFQVAIIDPPRSGCHSAVLEWLSAEVEEQLIYVSCDPTTLARDLKHLTAHGWIIESIQPFDMFPQTYHLETVVSLKH